MSYDDYEFSVRGGAPIFLYQFGRGATVWYFVADEEAITYDGITWEPSSVAHDNIPQNGNVERQDIPLEFHIADEFAFGLLIPQVQVTTLTIFRAHRFDPDEERRMYWKGRVVGAMSGPDKLEIRTENIFSSMRRNGCHARVQRSCRHDLYGAFTFGGVGCQADPTDFDHAVTITALNGIFLTVPAAASLTAFSLKNGMIKWNDIYGMIEYHSGATLRLTAEIPGLEEALEGGSQSATVYDGCNRGLTGAGACAHFDQQLNYGGFRWIPKSDPWKSAIA